MAQGGGALTVDEALARILAGASATSDVVERGLLDAAGCVLASPLVAKLTQPPFNSSAMDGYAVRGADVAQLPAMLDVIGESAAGHGFGKPVGPGQAVRIFTGAPIPEGADAIVIQENTRRDGSRVMVHEGVPDPEFVRPRGADFRADEQLIPDDRRLTARDLTLAAAMGHGQLTVRRRPTVAILATGDELVAPGTMPGADQIICSNTYGIAAMLKAAGAEPQLLGIARDSRSSLETHVAKAGRADILITVGGASVGDHDLVGPVLRDHGMALDFWKIAMRPGKPLMFGRLARQRVLGLPGNPVSSLVCTRLFAVPLVRALLGLDPEPRRATAARTSVELEANGARAHYMRAHARTSSDGVVEVAPVRSQDSSLMRPLSEADCLIVRPIGAGPVPVGGMVPILQMDF